MKTVYTGIPPRDQAYESLLLSMNRYFIMETKGKPVFRVAVTDLASRFLSMVPVHQRQTHKCHTCRDFINRYGNLVTVKDTGLLVSAVWPDDDLPAEYAFIRLLRIAYMNSRIENVFISDAGMLGTPVTGPWTHFAVPNQNVYTGSETPDQVTARKTEEFGMLSRAIAQYPMRIAARALEIIKGDVLYRSDKVLGVAQWFMDVHMTLAGAHKNSLHRNLLWRAVATAPTGFCHINSTMIGTLLDSLNAGLSIDTVIAQFRSKMSPLQYMRPQSAPTAGNIQQAEKIFADLNLASAMRRRFARLDDLEPVMYWKPTERATRTQDVGGLFSGLLPKSPSEQPLQLPRKVSTWTKFANEMLPDAIKIQVLVPSSAPFVAFTTAVDPEAEPILRWDSRERPMPLSMYTYYDRTHARDWNLLAGTHVDLTAIVKSPDKFDDRKGAFLIIRGARDKHTGQGLSLFPENLRPELHGVRATIEAYSEKYQLEGREEASACGLYISSVGVANYELRVTNRSGTIQDVLIDRWD